MGMKMRVFLVGFILLLVACATIVTQPPTAQKLLICAGVNQIYYDRIHKTWLGTHPEVDKYYRAAITLQSDPATLNSLFIQEGIYQSRILNDDELVTEIKRCKRLLPGE